MSDAYANAGVDTNIEAQASRIMYEASKQTFKNRKGKIGDIHSLFDDFAGLRFFDVSNLPAGSCASMNADGSGTKVCVVQRSGKYAGLAYDLVAMLADDAAILGAEPIAITNVLDLKSLGMDARYLPIVSQLGVGLVSAARKANVGVINGEIAQMGACISGYGKFPFNWSGSCLWFGKHERLISRKYIRAGLAIVMLRERGFRCNGLQLVDDIFTKKYGSEWHKEPFGPYSHSTLGDKVSTPSTIYTPFLVHLHGGFAGKRLCKIFGAANITGGGIPEKLGRMLKPSGRGARLDNLFEPDPIVGFCQNIGCVPDYDAYKAWGMGQGLAIVTDDPDFAVGEAPKFGLEGKCAGRVTAHSDISLISRGLMSPGSVLEF